MICTCLYPYLLQTTGPGVVRMSGADAALHKGSLQDTQNQPGLVSGKYRKNNKYEKKNSSESSTVLLLFSFSQF